MPTRPKFPMKSVEPEHLEGDLVQSGHPLFGIVWVNPERMSGTPCFFGTRVPIKNLFDYIETGETIEMFLDDFPGVLREEVVAVLELARESLLPTNTDGRAAA